MAHIFTKAQAEIAFLQLKKKILHKMERFFPQIDSNCTIHRFLERKFKILTESYKKMPAVPVAAQKTDASEPAAIWVFWWQGYDNAPPLVKKCIDSIRLHAGNHSVILLTSENCKSYAALPEYVWEKLENKHITLTHFSDILRMKLLSVYGGLWLDATIFVSKDIPEDCFAKPFFTIHYPTSTSTITSGKWTIYCQCAGQDFLLHQYCLDIFLIYLKTYNKFVDYFFTDYIIAHAYEHIPAIHEAIDSVPENNAGVKLLDRLFYEPYNADTYKQVLESAVFHKLNWKRNYPEKGTDGKETCYQHFMQS